MVPDLTQGKWFATDQEESTARAAMANLNSIITVARAGKAQSEQEMKLLAAFRATLGKLTRNNIAAVQEIINYYTGELRLFEDSNQIPPYRRQVMRGLLSGGVPVGAEGLDPSRYEKLKTVK
jgi:hypothetical protein